MPFFGATHSCRIAYQLRSQSISIPWFLKTDVKVCLKGRVYSSSVPVRYNPKKKRDSPLLASPLASSSEKIEASERPELEKEFGHDVEGYGLGQKAYVSTKMSQNQCRPMNDSGYGFGQKAFVSAKKSQNQCKISMNDSEPEKEIDHEFVGRGVGQKSFVSAMKSHNQCKIPTNDSEKEIDHVIVDCGVGEGFEELTTDRQKDDHERKVSPVNKTKQQEAEKLAVELLSRRAFTAAELRKKLHAKNFSSDIVEAVLHDFQGRGLINDCFYAEAYSRSRWSSSSWGPKRIKHALSRKGVSEEVVQKAVTQVFREGVKDEDEDSKFGLSKLSIDHLFVQASKQWLRGQGLPSDTRKSRIIRWLTYRGFNWDVINFILKKLQFQLPP